jgi:hypothetical protein
VAGGKTKMSRKLNYTYHPFHRGDLVALKTDGSLHMVAHVYKDGILLFEDFLKCRSSEVTMKIKKTLYGFISMAYDPPRFVADEDLFDYLPPRPVQLELF